MHTLAQAAETTTAPEFAGTAEQQTLAARLFQLFQRHGRFFGDRAPIRMTVEALAAYFEQHEAGEQNWMSAVEAALNANPRVFSREEHDGQTVFVTTRSGVPPTSLPPTTRSQTLTRRFATPEPKREPAPQRRRASGVVPTLAFQQPAAIPSPYEPDSWQAAVAASLREAEEARIRDEEALAVREIAGVAAEADHDAGDPRQATGSTEPWAVDASTVTVDELEEAIRQTLGREMSVARWGDRWMAEERVQRFSRGDLRRIEDLLREQSDPVSDLEIVQDIMGIRPTAPEFETARFALNYRLSHETREFEFLGTDTIGRWALANQTSIGAVKRKAAEIGQDYRFLLDYRAALEPLADGLVEHVLTFYEYQYGLLPLDTNVGAIMPAQGFPDQRAARITFESPQTNDTLVAELRFPTSNRGGFIAGLEDFYAANLVPGAVLTIERTDDPTRFLLEYFQVSGEDRKLLHLDERKGRYTFRSTTFYCATQADMLLTESNFPKLADAKPLEERAKRRPEQVVAATFERVGEHIGSPETPRFRAAFADLLAVANVERPISAELLRDILSGGAFEEFTADDNQEDTFIYQPATGG